MCWTLYISWVLCPLGRNVEQWFLAFEGLGTAWATSSSLFELQSVGPGWTRLFMFWLLRAIDTLYMVQTVDLSSVSYAFSDFSLTIFARCWHSFLQAASRTSMIYFPGLSAFDWPPMKCINKTHELFSDSWFDQRAVDSVHCVKITWYPYTMWSPLTVL